MAEKEQYVWSLQDYLNVIRRRKFWLLLPFGILFSLSVMLAWVLPATYQSQATIMIEEQALPSDLIRSTITSYAAQQVQVISQRVLTVENIGTIIKNFKMYLPDSAAIKNPGVKYSARFRDSMNLELVSADVIDPRSGRPTQATIAFTLAFTDADPTTAKEVTAELVRLFLSENQRDRAQQASSATDFLAAEADALNKTLLEQEERLAEFKTANEGSLPSQYKYNLEMIERSQRELSDIRLRSQELAKRKIELAARLSQLSPSAPQVLTTGDVVLSDEDRLKSLQTEYRRKAAIYRDNHPDVVRLEREIEALQAELGISTDINDLRSQLQEQQQHLTDLRGRYNDNHQQVQSTRRVIAQLESNIQEAASKGVNESAPIADNPAYVVLQTELYTVESDVRGMGAREQELNEKIAHYETLLRRAPEVERAYQALLRGYDSTNVEYTNIKRKQRDALTSQNLEQEGGGQRFVLVERPRLPRQPVSPNRPAIVFIGFILAAGAAFGAILLRETMDQSIHGLSQLTWLLGEAPLVAIPYIDNRADIVQRRRTWMLVFAAIAGCLLVFYGLLYIVLKL